MLDKISLQTLVRLVRTFQKSSVAELTRLSMKRRKYLFISITSGMDRAKNNTRQDRCVQVPGTLPTLSCCSWPGVFGTLVETY